MGKYIRKAEKRDLIRIAEIYIFNYRLNFYPIFKNDAYYFIELQSDILAKSFEEKLSNLFVYDDGAVKGFIETEKGEIKKLFVEPVLHSHGIGSNLIQYAITHKEHPGSGRWKKIPAPLLYTKSTVFIKPAIGSPKRVLMNI